MTTIAELVDETPAATRGVAAGFEYGTGVWRHVVELADPSAGSSVEWFDITEWFTGYDYTRGADSYLGRYRAGVVNMDLFAGDDRFAPWNEDTSDTFGVHVSLGPGLLIRSGFILVSGGVVTDWNPRFTCKVEFWGDASYSQGKVRQHRIVARDTMTALVNVPIPADTEENWTDRIGSVLTAAGWEYGSTIYGPTTIGGVGVLPLPDRDAQSSAINELDASTDPAGAVWYTNRKGELIVRASVYDTWQAGRFDPGGAAGTPYPVPDPVVFAWWSCTGETPPGDYGDLDTATTSAYAVDTRGIDPFGLDRSERGVINHVVVTSPSGTFDDDDPTSIQRYDRQTLQASWITANDFAAADILAARANATLEARPLTATVDLTRFHPGPAEVDYLDPVEVWHRNGNGLEVHASGWLRSYRELVRPVGCDTDWTITYTLDVFEATSRNPFLLPVTDLELTTVTDLAATFTWGNPTQVIDPTHTQIRMNGGAWTTTAYPLTGVTWSGLTPYTAYEFEVRLIRVDDTIVTHFSPTRSVIFITDTPDDPFVDGPDTPGGDVDVTFPPPDEDCTLEWELQSSPDGTTWTTIDDGEVTEPPYTLTYDTSTLDDELYYRFRSREVCGGVPGAWHNSNPFVVNCLPVSQLGVPPFDDANLVAYWPQVCNTTVEEAVSDEPMTLGGAFDRVDFDAAGLPVMHSYGEGVIGSGVQPVTVAGSSDLTIACRLSVGVLPSSAEPIIFGYGGLYFRVETSGGGYLVTGHCIEAGVGTITIGGGPTVLALDTEYTLTLTHDVGGTLSLYVDGALEDASVSSIGARGGTFGGLYQIGAPADSWVTDCAVWDTVLTPTPPGPPFTGGTESDAGGYHYHTFTTSGTLTPTGAGGSVEYLVVAGGGPGGNAAGSSNNASGGGGAGGVLTGTGLSITSAQTITVGAGGTAPNGSAATNGQDSSIGSLVIATGGGAGSRSGVAAAVTGGSGGGGSASHTSGAAGTSGQGFAGGNGAGSASASQARGGGGGGAGAAGTNAVLGGAPGVGGAGIEWPAGSGNYYGGGGGGGARIATTGGGGDGGIGGGGEGGDTTASGNQGDPGVANTGGGGGGSTMAGAGFAGGAGGSGVVIVRYPYP